MHSQDGGGKNLNIIVRSCHDDPGPRPRPRARRQAAGPAAHWRSAARTAARSVSDVTPAYPRASRRWNY